MRYRLAMEKMRKRFRSYLNSPEYKNQQLWNRRFMELAILVSSWSKDPSSKVGIHPWKRRL